MATDAYTEKPAASDLSDKPRAVKHLEEYQLHKGLRANFEGYWQSLHDYFYIEAEDINSQYMPGAELKIDALYDATTLDAPDVLASGFMNYLTPPTSKWFALRPRNPKLKDNKRVQMFLSDVAEEVNSCFNRTNFYEQMFPSYKSSGVYGTSVVIEEEDVSEDAIFTNMPISNCVLIEDASGRVIKYYIEFEWTAEQAGRKFGIEKLSNEMQDEIKSDRTTAKKHKFLLFIGQRWIRDVRKSDKKNLPIEAIWIDVQGKIIVEEGGYNEFPAFCHRFDKRPRIVWGFSPGMKALPFARMLNAVAKTTLRSDMKHADPPIAIPDGAFLMPFNQNPRAVNYYNKNKMDGSKDIFAFGNYGNPNVGMSRIEYYTLAVKSMMYNDVFLAFDNLTKQMNNPEIMERINEKMSMLGPAVGRYITGIIHPAIVRTIGIKMRKGQLPKPPDEFLMDPGYEIDCVSQLAQAQRRSELNSLITGLGLVGNMAPMVPDVMDKIDPDKVVDEAWGIIGATPRVLRSDDEIQRIREGRQAAQAQAAAIKHIQQSADAVKTGSDIDKNLAEAGAKAQMQK